MVYPWVMKPHISNQTKRLDVAILATVRRQLGRNFVALLCIGSRARGTNLNDSDYDGSCYVRDISHVAKLDFSDIAERFNIRIGIGLRPWSYLVRVLERGDTERGRIQRREWLLGKMRFVGGRRPQPKLVPIESVLRPDWRREMQFDYWMAALPDLPSNVLCREPRRHVGYVIAACSQLLEARGLAVRKEELPKALQRYYPRSGLVSLLRRALRRRRDWQRISSNPRTIVAARHDAEDFLVAFQKYVFPTDGSGMTAAQARKQRRAWVAEMRGAI